MLVDQIRHASRLMVRELGFMGGSFAGSDLSPSAVHALIEIGAGRAVTARDLARTLRLDKSGVSRMLRRLVLGGEVVQAAGEDDGRVKVLSLTPAGEARLRDIHAFGRAQVTAALDRLPAEKAQTVLEGLHLYADALAGPDGIAAPPVSVAHGYRSGLIAAITGMHADYYGRVWGLGQPFESLVAGGLAEFCGRLDQPQNGIWTAQRGSEIVGSIAIDGQAPDAGVAHLRWFLLADGLRGQGVGQRLIGAALAHADRIGRAETHLWTFAGLDSARHIYERHGFRLAEEREGARWGRLLLEQRFVRPRPGESGSRQG